MTQNINKTALFNASCLALITTAFSFSIRAGILPQLGDSFGLSAEQLGFINSMWFLGFPISMILGGLFYHKVGAANIMRIAFVAHTLGILLTIYAGGYTTLLLSTLFIGFGNGCTEAACNPMIADMYEGNKMNKMMNRFHMWFPGGIVVGSLISEFMTNTGGILGNWQTQMWILMIPTIIYAILFFGKAFPKPKMEAVTSIVQNLKAMASPVFIFLFICMIFTATTEFGTTQWANVVLNSSGASGMLLLALTTGVMAVGRYFGGPIVAKFGQTGVLLASAVLSTIGIFMFSTVTGPMAYVAAIIFGTGVCFFWPVMIGATAQRAPLTGALGMSIIGGVGMLSNFVANPITGRWIDSARSSNEAAGLTGNALELATGQETLEKMILVPGILIILFIIFFFWQKGTKPTGSAAH